MQLYRIGKTKHAHDLTGVGAKMNGGRWNYLGVPCIYLSESRALSLLEYSRHTSLETMPPALSYITFDVPEHSIRTFQVSDLPVNWLQRPYSKENRDLGSLLLAEADHLLFKIPSPIIEQEYNFVLNTNHHLINLVKITEVISYKG
ncbi:MULTISPECIES: RES family NAD+ phosphorylase [Niastella]|uniref:RES family NAD+ phosphorylase n=1 Tax=Niastella soli TaxID=2821487 RepID=A0ABS3Z1D9_9BACT|nr:RES family NAD+ phosphorylase [Niastella soli]MBO9203977.1 RES family NAD+ phosphorylase [Niastella soli]